MKKWSKNGKTIHVATSKQFQSIKIGIISRQISIERLVEDHVKVNITTYRGNKARKIHGEKTAKLSRLSNIYYAEYYDHQLNTKRVIVLNSQQAKIVCSIQRPTPDVIRIGTGDDKNAKPTEES